MKAIGAAFVAGVLGVLVGSLAAQGPDAAGGLQEDVIFEGPVAVEVLPAVPGGKQDGQARVSEGWVYLTEKRILIPREQILAVTAGEAGRDFGEAPDAERQEERRRRFRED